MKIQMTPMVIEPMTFWLVAISLNQLHHHVPQQEVSVYTAVITLYKSFHSNVDEVLAFLQYNSMSIGEWLLTSFMGLLVPSLGSMQTKKTGLLTPTRWRQ
jgi:hypothetical protein